LRDFIGGDLLGFDLDKWASDVEKYGALAVYAPAEGGYEGRYAVRLKSEGYHFMNISARGLGDPEAYLTKVHGVRPVSSPFFLPLAFNLSIVAQFCTLSDECMQCLRGYKKFSESHSSSSEWIVQKRSFWSLVSYLPCVAQISFPSDKTMQYLRVYKMITTATQTVWYVVCMRGHS
jgi:hypothetical protein